MDSEKQPSAQSALNPDFHDENVSSFFLAFFSFPGWFQRPYYSYIYMWLMITDPHATRHSPHLELEGLPSKTTFPLTPIIRRPCKKARDTKIMLC